MGGEKQVPRSARDDSLEFVVLVVLVWQLSTAKPFGLAGLKWLRAGDLCE